MSFAISISDESAEAMVSVCLEEIHSLFETEVFLMHEILVQSIPADIVINNIGKHNDFFITLDIFITCGCKISY